jgi:hypothetical protein
MCLLPRGRPLFLTIAVVMFPSAPATVTSARGVHKSVRGVHKSVRGVHKSVRGVHKSVLATFVLAPDTVLSVPSNLPSALALICLLLRVRARLQPGDYKCAPVYHA